MRNLYPDPFTNIVREFESIIAQAKELSARVDAKKTEAQTPVLSKALKLGWSLWYIDAEDNAIVLSNPDNKSTMSIAVDGKFTRS
jgi:hypothetical protein